jgi:hypothetical protein
MKKKTSNSKAESQSKKRWEVPSALPPWRYNFLVCKRRKTLIIFLAQEYS